MPVNWYCYIIPLCSVRGIGLLGFSSDFLYSHFSFYFCPRPIILLNIIQVSFMYYSYTDNNHVVKLGFSILYGNYNCIIHKKCKKGVPYRGIRLIGTFLNLFTGVITVFYPL